MQRKTRRQKHVNEFFRLQGHHTCGITTYQRDSKKRKTRNFSMKLSAAKTFSIVVYLITGIFFITESSIDLSSPGSITIDNLFILAMGILMILIVPIVLIYERRMITSGRIYGLH